MTALEILVAARDLVAKGWCQGTLARDSCNEYVRYFSSEAAFFCTLGAVFRAHYTLGSDNASERTRALSLLEEELPKGYRPAVSEWNDAKERKQEVVALFDAAIVKEKL